MIENSRAAEECRRHYINNAVTGVMCAGELEDGISDEISELITDADRHNSTRILDDITSMAREVNREVDWLTFEATP